MNVTDDMIERAARASWHTLAEAAWGMAWDQLPDDGDAKQIERDRVRAMLEAAIGDTDPHHYYFATFTDDDVSQTTDTEPRTRRHYTILRGPYRTAVDAWGDGMDDTDWDAVCVMRWMGADHTGTCYVPFTDEFDDFWADEIDHDALFETIRVAVASAKGNDDHA